MANVLNRLVTFKDTKLWVQNEGQYNMFYGVHQPYYVQHRITPSPYSDKIFNTVEYRADMFNANDELTKVVSQIEDENISNSEEYKEIQRLIEIQKCKDYLSSTDYVISKLNEAKIESEEEYQNLKEKYQETLVKRAEARKRINELGG